jgi:hypothetical protein
MDKPSLIVFQGKRQPPYFNFAKPWFEAKLDYPAPDLEILDVNKDNAKDIYVVQVDEDGSDNAYCTSSSPEKWWKNVKGSKGPDPAPNWRPPLDQAKDYLFMGQRSKTRFRQVKLQHSLPGCGFLAQRFGDDKTMILSQGNFQHPGQNLLLEW